MENVSLGAALDLERYILIGQGAAVGAAAKAKSWIEQERAGHVVFEAGVGDVLERVIAGTQSH